MNGGLTNVVMGRSFEDGFIQGAMGGAVGGFIGYMIGLGLKGLSNDQGNGTASNESPASSDDLNFEDHLPDRGPGGVGYGGPRKKYGPNGEGPKAKEKNLQKGRDPKGNGGGGKPSLAKYVGNQSKYPGAIIIESSLMSGGAVTLPPFVFV